MLQGKFNLHRALCVGLMSAGAGKSHPIGISSLAHASVVYLVLAVECMAVSHMVHPQQSCTCSMACQALNKDYMLPSYLHSSAF